MNEEKTNGLVQIYTGNGKGKSTAAFGLSLRAAGCGMRTVIVQFMKKGEWYGEIEGFKQVPLVEIYSFGTGNFLKKGSPPDDQNVFLAAAAMNKAKEIMCRDDVDILILDELNNAIYFDLVSEGAALELLGARPDCLEIVITGRNAPDSLINVADLVTEMQEIKHPYQKGIQARKGIEF